MAVRASGTRRRSPIPRWECLITGTTHTLLFPKTTRSYPKHPALAQHNTPPTVSQSIPTVSQHIPLLTNISLCSPKHATVFQNTPLCPKTPHACPTYPTVSRNTPLFLETPHACPTGYPIFSQNTPRLPSTPHARPKYLTLALHIPCIILTAPHLSQCILLFP